MILEGLIGGPTMRVPNIGQSYSGYRRKGKGVGGLIHNKNEKKWEPKRIDRPPHQPPNRVCS